MCVTFNIVVHKQLNGLLLTTRQKNKWYKHYTARKTFTEK